MSATCLDDVDVVIVNHQSWEHLEHCLASLSGGKITVVDNGGPAATVVDFQRRFPHVRFIGPVPNKGFGAACNTGAAKGTAPVIALINPDTRDGPDGLRVLRDYLNTHPDVAIAGPGLVDLDGQPQKSWDVFPGPANLLGPVRRVRRGAIAQPEEGFAVPWVSGAALMIRREVFESLGGFDESYFMYSEDVDLCKRALDSGWSTFHIPQALIAHGHAGSSRINRETTRLTKTEKLVSRLRFATVHMKTPLRITYAAVIFWLSVIPSIISATCIASVTLRAWWRALLGLEVISQAPQRLAGKDDR